MSNACDATVLKNLMLYLKTKSLTSENAFKMGAKDSNDMLMDLFSIFQRYYDQAPETDKQILHSILDLIIVLSQQVRTSLKQAESALDDSKIYIAALESAYKTMDGTFEKSVAEPAKKEAEAKVKEEEERNKPLDDLRKVRPRFYE